MSEASSQEFPKTEAPIVGRVEQIACTIAQCGGCLELRYAEIVCLPCDWPDDAMVREMVAKNRWRCTCFDWPEETTKS